MCVFSAPKTPAPPPTPASAPVVQSYTNTDAVEQAQQDERRRQAVAAGYLSTIQTSGLGLATQAPTTGKTLLGQ